MSYKIEWAKQVIERFKYTGSEQMTEPDELLLQLAEAIIDDEENPDNDNNLNTHYYISSEERAILNSPISDQGQVIRIKDQIEERKTGHNPHNYEKYQESLKKRWEEYWKPRGTK